MKKGMIKAVVLTVVFFASIVGFGYFTNQNGVNLTTEMAGASFPTLTVAAHGKDVAFLYGYDQDMEIYTMRGPVIPIDESRSILVKIDTHGNPVEALSYEIRSMDGSRLIAETETALDKPKDTRVEVKLTLQNLVEAGKEYQLLFRLRTTDQKIRYYTRLMKDKDQRLEKYLGFAKDFCKATFAAGGEQFVSTYLEPDLSQNSTDLHKVTINSSVSQVCWGDFQGTPMNEPVFELQELNDAYGVVTTDYVLTAVGEAGELEYYNVKEYYRVSYNESGDRCYLHNYERTLEQIFRADGENFYENYVQLGIRDGQVAYKKSEDQKITCFEQQGEIWSYNENTGFLTRIFSFRGFEGIDPRENNNRHHVEILNIDEGGNVNFAISGYMNRGVHEGQVGVGIYHFDNLTMTVEELLFLPSLQAPERLLADNQNIIYQNLEGNLFVLLNERLYQINPADRQVQILAQNLTSGAYLFNGENHLFAWLTDDRTLSIYDLEKATTDQITVKKSQKIQLLGVLEEDLVYGVCRKKDPVMENDRPPMAKIVIYSPVEKKSLKSYYKKGTYISSVEMDESVITLHRMVWGMDGYEATADDAIMNQAGDELLDENLVENREGIKQKRYLLALQGHVDTEQIKFVNSREIVLEEDRNLMLKDAPESRQYFVYAQGDCVARENEIGDAIRLADEVYGIVVDQSMNYVWKRAKKQAIAPIMVAAATMESDNAMVRCLRGMLPEEYKNVEISMLLEDTSEKDILQKVITDATVYEIRGCQLSQMLYYISHGTPVLAYPADHSPCLLVGYDAYNIWVYDPVSGETTRQSMDNMTKELNRTGNRFIVYVR